MAFIDNSTWTLDWIALNDMVGQDLVQYQQSIYNKNDWVKYCKLYSKEHAFIQVCKQDNHPVAFMTVFIQNTRNNKDKEEPYVFVYDFRTMMNNIVLDQPYKSMKVEQIDQQMIKNVETFTDYRVIYNKNL